MITRTAAISVVMRHSRRVVCLLATLRAIAGVTETFKEFVVIAINIVVDIIVVVVIVVVIIIVVVVVVVVVVIIVVVVEGTNEKPAVNWMTSVNFTNVPKKISSQLVQWRSSSYDEFLVIKY